MINVSFLTNSKSRPNGAYVPPMPNQPPMPEIKPPCKMRLNLTCSPENIWVIKLGDNVLFLANSHQEMIDKLTKLTEIIN